MSQYWQRLTEDMSCRAAAWGPLSWHRNRSFGHNKPDGSSWWEAALKSQAFVCCARTVFLLGAGLPKKTRSDGSPDVYSCVSGKHTYSNQSDRRFYDGRRWAKLEEKSSQKTDVIPLLFVLFLACAADLNTLVSLETSVLTDLKITHWCWQKQTHYTGMRFLRIHSPLEDWYP